MLRRSKTKRSCFLWRNYVNQMPCKVLKWPGHHYVFTHTRRRIYLGSIEHFFFSKRLLRAATAGSNWRLVALRGNSSGDRFRLSETSFPNIRIDLVNKIRQTSTQRARSQNILWFRLWRAVSLREVGDPSWILCFRSLVTIRLLMYLISVKHNFREINRIFIISRSNVMPHRRSQKCLFDYLSRVKYMPSLQSIISCRVLKCLLFCFLLPVTDSFQTLSLRVSLRPHASDCHKHLRLAARHCPRDTDHRPCRSTPALPCQWRHNHFRPVGICQRVADILLSFDGSRWRHRGADTSRPYWTSRLAPVERLR